MTAAAIKPSRAHSALRVGSNGKSEPGCVEHVAKWIQLDPLRLQAALSSRPAQRLRTWCAHQRGRLTLAKGGTTVSKWIVTLLAAASLSVAACADAKLVTWTLRDVTFNDGGTASGFFTFDPIIVPSHDLRTRYLSDFSIKTTAGTTMTAPFEYSPANTDASVPWFVDFFSAPESPTPRHGMPQRVLRLYMEGKFPADGGRIGILSKDSTD